MPIDTSRVHYDHTQLLNSHGGTAEDTRRAFDLIVSVDVNPQALISKEMGLTEIDQAFDQMIEGRVIKVALNPDR